jgi:branched-chain amino acid transport system substrate-binding protein
MGKADPKLAAEYKKRFKDDPGVYTLETYNSANFFLDAIAKGNKTRATILAYIDTFRFKGVGMELFFNEKGDVDSTLINQFVIKNGKVEYVKAVIK